MNERIEKYLKAMLSRLALPLAPYKYTERYLSHVMTNDWETKAFMYDDEAQIFIGHAVLTHGLLSMPWGAHTIYASIASIGDGDVTKKSMLEATMRSCMLWDYATSMPISEVLKNKHTHFYIDNESLFIDMTIKHSKAIIGKEMAS